MKNMLLILFALLASSTLCAQKTDTNEEALCKMYHRLAGQNNCITSDVKYTGSDFSKAGGGFILQRGNGKGWTQGKRLTLLDVKLSKADAVMNIFNKLKRKHIYGEYAAAVFMEDTKNVYAFSYDKNAKTLHFLRATAENEVCVPIIWKEADYVDASVFNKYEKVSKKDLRQLGLARLWAGIKQNFVFMNRLKFDIDSLYAAYIPLMDKTEDDRDAIDLLQRFAALMGDGHTFVYGVGRNNAAVCMNTKYIDGHVYVESVFEKGLEKNGVKRGDELISINDESVLEYGKRRIMPYVSSSTPQWTIHETYENQGLLRCNENETLKLTFKNKKGKVRTVSYSPKKAVALERDNEPFTFEMLKDNIGYLKINSFMCSGDYPRMFNKIMPDVMKSASLIVDIRNNSGGNSGNSEYVLRLMTRDSVLTNRWTSPVYIPAYTSWGLKADWLRVPSKKIPHIASETLYEKPVALLVDRGTFSAAEDFCAMFKSMKRGVIIGSKTGGSTGNGVRVELIPDVNVANICSKYDIAADGTDFVGRGLEPTIEVEETYDSFFKDEYDAAITAAMNYLK